MLQAQWITTGQKNPDCPIFQKNFYLKNEIKQAILNISAKGVYEAVLNGLRIGDFILAPGWTAYNDRIQYQTYNITELLKSSNTLTVQLAGGWFNGKISEFWNAAARSKKCALIAKLTLTYQNGETETIRTDNTWQVANSGLLYCDIYNGLRYDARIVPHFTENAIIADENDTSVLIAQIGEKVVEHERFKPIEILHTPKGETVLDFGQNMAGYPEINLTAHKGDTVSFAFAEILDKDGNFYNENYRDAKCEYTYICREGQQTFKPTLTFYGFRYLLVKSFPGTIQKQNVTAVAVYSNIKQTGHIASSSPLLNRLFHNIIWGQKSNFLDIPTDCPQRDERYGWTGDAQVFVKTASYNFQVEKFFEKWLEDMAICQAENGSVPSVVPVYRNDLQNSAGWSDAVTICPWQIYLTYGNKTVLEKMFEPAKKWVDYITAHTTTQNLWCGGSHFGDWLELGLPYGVYTGLTRYNFIATAFYAYSTQILCKMGTVLGRDISAYEALYQNIKSAFQKEFCQDYRSQTEYVLALHFELAENKEATAKALAERIHQDGDKLQTGFIGTPYLLHALSTNGYADLAYKLLLRTDYPSWLYPISKGATTMWEHWDGIKPDGQIWPAKMNSYNHYAYGAVADWMYGVAAGIQTVEGKPGFESVHFAPIATDRLDFFFAEIETKFGKIRSGWHHENGKTVYEITTPVPATATLNGQNYTLSAGCHKF